LAVTSVALSWAILGFVGFVPLPSAALPWVAGGWLVVGLLLAGATLFEGALDAYDWARSRLIGRHRN
jgi:hypothetical protein